MSDTSIFVRLARVIRAALFGPYHGRESFSQEGEDMMLSRMFEGRLSGFYVDVGAHHPTRFSNTHYFYKLGWRGVNIDAMPGSMDAFKRMRPRDVNIEVGVGERCGTQLYHVFNDPALNTFSQELADEREALSRYWVVEKIEVPVRPLADILEEYVPDGQQIDFLSVDVEGLDEIVLRSNDWTRFRPRVVLVEVLKSSLRSVVDDDLTVYLEGLGYEPYAKAVNTIIFRSVD